MTVEYMAGPPDVSTVDGESRRILDRAGAGFFSPPEDAEALARLVSQLSEGGENLDAIGRRGVAGSRYSSARVVSRLAHAFGAGRR